MAGAAARVSAGRHRLAACTPTPFDFNRAGRGARIRIHRTGDYSKFPPILGKADEVKAPNWTPMPAVTKATS